MTTEDPNQPESQPDFQHALTHLHEANRLREHGGGSTEVVVDSVAHAREAAAAFEKLATSDATAYAGESHASAALGLDRLHRITGDVTYLNQAVAEGEAGVALAKQSGQEAAIPIPSQMLGKMYRERAHWEYTLGEKTDYRSDLVKAVTAFDEALRHPLPHSHDFRLMHIELMSQWAATDLELTMAEGRDVTQANALIEQLYEDFRHESGDQYVPGETTSLDKSYEKTVWWSGLAKRYADLLVRQRGGLAKAEEYLQLAEKICSNHNAQPGAQPVTLRQSDIILTRQHIEQAGSQQGEGE